MKALIIYASRGGATKEAAEMLADALQKKADVQIFDINDDIPRPDGFDVAVLGSSVIMGKINKKLKKYIKANLETLSNMDCGVFLCCGLIKDFDDYKTMQLPRSLHASLGIECFGGELKPDKIKGFDKLLVKIMRESILTQDPDKSDEERHELPELLTDNIYAMAQKICGLLA